eukprot:1158871-Pelagomonas_calceolata.AAC.10
MPIASPASKPLECVNGVAVNLCTAQNTSKQWHDNWPSDATADLEEHQPDAHMNAWSLEAMRQSTAQSTSKSAGRAISAKASPAFFAALNAIKPLPAPRSSLLLSLFASLLAVLLTRSPAELASISIHHSKLCLEDTTQCDFCPFQNFKFTTAAIQQPYTHACANTHTQQHHHHQHHQQQCVHTHGVLPIAPQLRLPRKVAYIMHMLLGKLRNHVACMHIHDHQRP